MILPVIRGQHIPYLTSEQIVWDCLLFKVPKIQCSACSGGKILKQMQAEIHSMEY